MSGVPTYGFIMHPLGLEDVYDFEPSAKDKPAALVKKVLTWMKDPFEIASVRITTDTGAEVLARIQCVPRLPEQMVEDTPEIRDLVIRAAQALEQSGCKIVGLGAYTAIVADHGRLVQKAVGVPVTSGNSFTVWSAIEATKEAASNMKIELAEAKTVVIGATGSIGRICAQLLANEVRELVLVGRRSANLIGKLSVEGDNVRYSNDIRDSLLGADVVLSASNDPSVIVQADDLKPGCVVCDIARPRDVAEEATKGEGFLVIEGGIVRLPGIPRWTSNYPHFNNLGLPPNLSFACFAETALRTLEPSLLRSSLGINIKEFGQLAEVAVEHGFSLAGLRNFDRQITEETIKRTRRKARMRVISRVKHRNFWRKPQLGLDDTPVTASE